MGLLDDAIREHLDLKRRRGADAEEIERAEREALGPVRRGVEEPDQGEPALEDAIAYDHEAEDEWGERFDHDLEPVEAHDEEFEPPADELEPLEPTAPDHSDAEPPLPEDPSLPSASANAPVPPAPHPAPSPPDHLGVETEEYDVEEGLPEEGLWEDAAPEADRPPQDAERHPPRRSGEGQSHDDMLEETPEFLQDTPDHDRLWFEQRPPRDFDFDG